MHPHARILYHDAGRLPRRPRVHPNALQLAALHPHIERRAAPLDRLTQERTELHLAGADADARRRPRARLGAQQHHEGLVG